MWSAVIVAVWLGIQPWALWPGLFQETSHRLTLVCCCVTLGLLRFGDARAHQPLPRSVGWWVAALLLVMTSHHWHLIREASYFQFFQETALFADGVLMVIALTWGLWALWQLPIAWARWLPWCGVALVSLNLVLACAQQVGIPWTLGTFHPGSDFSPELITKYGLSPYRPSGFMGFDRSLGAYAVAWLPILWTWKRWAAFPALGCICLASKVTTWVGVGVVAWWLLPEKWKGVGVMASCVAALWWSDGDLAKKIPMRVMTWWHTAQAVSVYWWRGVGFHPMTSTVVRQHFGYALPGLHSDWLSLALHAGTLITAWAAGGMGWVARQRPRTSMARALQASLVALAVMSLGQSVVSQSSLASLAMIFAVWWWREQQGVMA